MPSRLARPAHSRAVTNLSRAANSTNRSLGTDVSLLRASANLAEQTRPDVVDKPTHPVAIREERSLPDARDSASSFLFELGERLQAKRQWLSGLFFHLAPHLVLTERQHPAIRVMYEDDRIGAEQTLRYEQGPQRVLTGNATRIPDHVSVALVQPQDLVDVQACIHACEDRDSLLW